MVSTGLQIVALCLAIVGLLGTLAATILPHWQVTAHVGTSIITATGQMRGLWMECTWMSTGFFQCRPFYSILAMSPSLKAAQAMMVISCLLTAAGIGASTAGMKCTLVLGPPSRRSKSLVAVSGGLCLVTSSLCTFVPVAWNTHTTVRQFYDPWYPSPVKYELGAAIYLGYAAATLTMAAGVMMALSCPEKRRRAGPPRHLRPRGRDGPPRGVEAAGIGTPEVHTGTSWVAPPPLEFVDKRAEAMGPIVEKPVRAPRREDQSSPKVHGGVSWEDCPPLEFVDKWAEAMWPIVERDIRAPRMEGQSSPNVHGGVRWQDSPPLEFVDKRRAEVTGGGVAEVGRWSPPGTGEHGAGPLVIQNHYALTNL
ncbi:unnamed protein product [Lampetra planeri]